CRVDENGGPLHLLEALLIEQTARLLVQVGVDRYEARLARQCIEVDLPGPDILLCLLAAVDVAVEDRHVAALAALRKGVADPTHAAEATRAADAVLPDAS